ncbi:MAG TPA: hypothetical protein VLI41_09425 [Phenylobacterium sp.]|uniref:DUF6894 family protein n=1 Tax=Phenylobacterium sp. TaxID=1871053 RepID=UPI002C009040|nr:hypothetical protein [Phenylobacterium sp.]HSV03413.1 hypothetical protein [Phenylobacterium sp.]
MKKLSYDWTNLQGAAERKPRRTRFIAMPKYYFHTEDGRRYPDEDGTDLPDLEAARLKATRILAELLKEQPRELLETGRLRVEVTDEHRRRVLAVAASLNSEVA